MLSVKSSNLIKSLLYLEINNPTTKTKTFNDIKRITNNY